MASEAEFRGDERVYNGADSGIYRNFGLSINDIDRSEFRSFSPANLRPSSEYLPPIEIVDSRNVQSVSADAPESELRRRIALDYASPAMRERGERLGRDMDAFAQRARANGISDGEVSETFRHVARILEAGPNARLSRDERLVLASQVMHNAAFPTEIRQNENTCSVTALEVRTYMQHPSAAAALVADVAARGSFTGHDGTVIRLDGRSLTPSALGTTDLSRESQSRSFASQLFQVTAANIANLNDPDFRSLRYEQRPPTRDGDFGEALVDSRTGRVFGHEPGAAGRPNGLIAASESITGRSGEGAAFLVNLERQGRTATRAGAFRNAEELGQRLEALTREGRMPAVIFVHANSDLFARSSNAVPRNLFNDGHFVTITGYDPVSRTIRYDDQYGPESDRNDRPVSLQNFYNATHVLRANDLLDRLTGARSTMSGEEFAGNLERITREYAQRWQSVIAVGGATDSPDVRADRDSARQRISDLSRGLTPAQRARVEAAMNARPHVRNRR